jgi:hypothetical protein
MYIPVTLQRRTVDLPVTLKGQLMILPVALLRIIHYYCYFYIIIIYNTAGRVALRFKDNS